MSDDEDFAPHFVYGPSHYTVISEPNYRETLSSSFEFLDFSKVASSKKRRPNVQATSPADGTTTSKNKSNAKRFKQAILCLSEDIQLSLALSLSMMPSVDDGPKKSRRKRGPWERTLILPVQDALQMIERRLKNILSRSSISPPSLPEADFVSGCHQPPSLFRASFQCSCHRCDYQFLE